MHYATASTQAPAPAALSPPPPVKPPLPADRVFAVTSSELNPHVVPPVPPAGNPSPSLPVPVPVPFQDPFDDAGLETPTTPAVIEDSYDSFPEPKSQSESTPEDRHPEPVPTTERVEQHTDIDSSARAPVPPVSISVSVSKEPEVFPFPGEGQPASEFGSSGFDDFGDIPPAFGDENAFGDAFGTVGSVPVAAFDAFGDGSAFGDSTGFEGFDNSFGNITGTEDPFGVPISSTQNDGFESTGFGKSDIFDAFGKSPEGSEANSSFGFPDAEKQHQNGSSSFATVPPKPPKAVSSNGTVTKPSTEPTQDSINRFDSFDDA